MAYQAVFQLSDGTIGALGKAVQQIGNALRALDELQVELVLHGDAVYFAETRHGEGGRLLDSLPREKVRVLACANALQARDIDPASIGNAIAIVASAVAHLIERQAAQWSYIKVD